MRILQRWDSCNDSNKKLFISNTSDNESDTVQPTWVISIELKNGNFKKPAKKQNVTIEKLPISSIPHQGIISPERNSILFTSSENSSSWDPSSTNDWIIFSTISLVILMNLFLFLLLRWKSASSEVEDKEEVVELAQTVNPSTTVVTQPAIIPIRSDPIRPTVGPKLMDYDSHLLLTPLRINRRQIQPSSSGFERGSLHSISSNNSNSSRSNSNSNSSNSVSMSAASSCKRFTPLPYPLMVPSSAQDTLLPFSSTSGGGGNRKQQVALSSSSFEDSPCKLNLQMGLLTPPTAERGVHRHLRTTATPSHSSVRGLLPGTDTDIGDLSDIYECNDVINESATLEDGSTSLFVDPVFADSHLDISELYRNTDVDGSNDHSGGGDDEDDSTPSNQNSLAEELASFFVDDNPALEALQLRQLSLPGTEKASSNGNHRSPSTSPCSLKTPLSQNGILSTSYNHEYIVGDSCLPKEENNLDLSKESIDVHNTEVENDGHNKTCIALEDSDKYSNGFYDNSSIFASPASFQEDINPAINGGMLNSTPLNNILTVRTSSTTKYDDEAAFGFSISNDCDKENLSPSKNEDTSFEMNKKIESHPLTPPALAASVVVDDRVLTAQIVETVEERSCCESTPKVLLDQNGLKPTSSQEQQQQQQHIDCSRSCSTRSIEYMAVERHYIDLNLSTMSADSHDDLDSVVPGFSKAYTSDGDDNETINLVRRPSINKIIEIELQSYVQQQLLNKEQLKAGPKTATALHLPPASKQSSNKSGNNFVINPKRAVPQQKQKQYGALNSSGGIGIGMEAKVRRASFSASGSRSRSRSPPPLPFEALQKSPPSKYNSTTSSPAPHGGKSKSVLNSSHGQVRKVADGVMNDLSPIKSTTTSSNARKMPGVTTTTSSTITTTATANEKAKKDVKYRKKS